MAGSFSRSHEEHFEANADHRDASHGKSAIAVVLWQVLIALIILKFGPQLAAALWFVR